MADLIFDEFNYAKNLLEGGIKKTYGRELYVISAFLRIHNNSEKLIEEKLINECVKCDPNFNIAMNLSSIRSLIRRSKRTKLSFGIENPVFRENELRRIRTIKDFQAQKLLFAELMIAKTLKRKYPELDSLWLPNTYISQAKTLAGIRIGKKKMRDKYHAPLYKAGFFSIGEININKDFDRGGIKFLFGEDFSPVVITIDGLDKENVNKYVDWCGGELGWCGQCGEEYVKSSKSPYCYTCKKEKRRIQKQKERCR